MTFKLSGMKFISDTPCPHCHKSTTYEEVINDHDWIDKDSSLVFEEDQYPFILPYSVEFKIYKCEHCGHYRLIVEKTKSKAYGEKDVKTLMEYPYPELIEFDTTKLPDIVRENLEEGLRCLNANAPKGAIVNFRRALQAAVLYLGGEGQDLFNQIENLYKKEIIRSKTKELAHKVRAFGKYGAHPLELEINKEGDIKTDEFGQLTIEDAVHAVKILLIFFEDAFLFPDKLKETDERLEELGKEE